MVLKIAITGSTGLVGSRIVALLQDTIQFRPLLQEEIDITDRDSVWKFLNGIQYDILLHLAAYTNVDKAEQERKLTYRINVEGTRNLFECVANRNKKFIYISTDFVFDGTNPPYDETSRPNPVGYYGQTKFEGEEVVKNNSMIVRIAYPYGNSPAEKKDFVRSLKYLLEQGRKLTMIEDSLITPTYIDDIAFGLEHLIKHFSPEIFHLVGSQVLSSFDSALLIAKMFQLDTSLIEKTTFEKYYKNNLIRPKLSHIVSKKNNFHRMRSFAEGLAIMKNKIL